MHERLAEDHRETTLAIASGVNIGMGGREAYRAWLIGQAKALPVVAVPPVAGQPKGDPAAIAAQNAAIGRLQRLFAQQPNPAYRNAVTVEN